MLKSLKLSAYFPKNIYLMQYIHITFVRKVRKNGKQEEEYNLKYFYLGI